MSIPMATDLKLKTQMQTDTKLHSQTDHETFIQGVFSPGRRDIPCGVQHRLLLAAWYLHLFKQ